MAALRSPTPTPSLEPVWRSTSVTHVGAVRHLNRDSIIERNETGLWAIADAMGGDNTPGAGSAAIARSLARIEPFESQYAGRRAVRTAMSEVNTQLFQRAKEERLCNIGASAIALLIRDGQYACLWVGNCRAYLLRGGSLRQISSDHCIDEPRADRTASGYRPILTRSIGSAPKLDMDAVGGDVVAGDRFLLCSDGLRILEDGELEQFMCSGPTSKALAGMLERALEIGASDNVSVAIVECPSA